MLLADFEFEFHQKLSFNEKTVESFHTPVEFFSKKIQGGMG